MAIVWTEKIGSGTVTLRDDDCECSPEEMSERHRQLDRTVSVVLENPVSRENLRRINRERYGIV